MALINAQPSHRQLSDAELAVMEELIDLRTIVGDYIEGMADSPAVDPTWLRIAREHLQQGFMAATRAVAKPSAF